MLVIEVQEGALLQGRAGQSGGGGSGSTPPGWTAVAVSAFSAAPRAQLAGNRGIGNVTSQPGRSASGRRHQPPGRRSALAAGLSSDGPTRKGER